MLFVYMNFSEKEHLLVSEPNIFFAYVYTSTFKSNLMLGAYTLSEEHMAMSLLDPLLCMGLRYDAVCSMYSYKDIITGNLQAESYSTTYHNRLKSLAILQLFTPYENLRNAYYLTIFKRNPTQSTTSCYYHSPKLTLAI
jgi:hypothetical protein